MAKGIKTKLMRAIPNHDEIHSVNTDSFVINGVTNIIWGACRDDDDIWIEMESNDTYGKLMRGRYYTHYEDIHTDFYPKILKSLGIN